MDANDPNRKFWWERGTQWRDSRERNLGAVLLVGPPILTGSVLRVVLPHWSALAVALIALAVGVLCWVGVEAWQRGRIPDSE